MNDTFALYQYYNCYLLEPKEGRETFYLKAFSEGVVFGSINLGEVEWWVLVAEDSGGSSVFRGQLLAMSAKFENQINHS